MRIIITSPSLNPNFNVSGISSVVNFIIKKNKEHEYLHFEDGSRDSDSKTFTSRIIRVIKSIKAWSNLLAQQKSAIIHFNLPLMAGAIIRDFFLLQIAHKKGKKVILHLHGGSLLKVRKRPWIINKLLTKIFAWSDSIITLSEDERQIIINDFNLQNVYSLPNCIDLDNAKDFNKSFMRKTLHLLYLGRIEKNKGIDFIFQSMQQLNDLNVDFLLHFAGKEENTDEYIPKFSRTLGNRFIYHGVVSGMNKQELLKECDVFLLPSMYEGLPMSLIETMAYGEVPIVTNVGSMSMVVQDKINGCFVNKCSSEDITKKISLLFEDKIKRETLSKAAQQTIFSLFDDKKYIAQLNQLYMK